MNKEQYDDVYVEWEKMGLFTEFDNYEEEEAYARWLSRLHH